MPALRLFRWGSSPGRAHRSALLRLCAVALTISLTACKLPPPNQPVAAGIGAPSSSQPMPSSAEAASAVPENTEPHTPAAPRLYPGTGVFIRAQPLSAQSKPETAEGDITLNFVDADVHDVVRSVLGDVLHLNYAFDPKLQGNVTVQTSRPLRRDDVLPTLEQVLRLSGMAIVQNDNVYRVVPIEEAVRSGSVTPGAASARGTVSAPNAAFSTQIVPLRYVSAGEVQRMLQPFVPKGGRVDADASRNLLIVSGTGQDLTAITELINTFDVDWLAGMSLGIFPLQNGTPKGVASELETIFAAGSGAPLAGLLRFVPLDRINSVLVISPQAAYLERVRTWIARLDQDDENTPRIYEYHVQNSRAADLAKVLSQLLSSGRVSTVDAQTAPGTTPTQLGGGLPSLGSSNGSSGLPSATSSMGGLGSSSSPLNPSPSSSSLSASPQQQAGYGAAAPAAGQQTDNSGGANSVPAVAPPDFAGAGSSGGAGNDAGLPQARVVADEKNNALVIFAKPRDYRMIEDTVRKLDVVPLQVLIEATIAEVTLNDNLQYGVEWFLQGSHNLFNLSNDPTGAVNLVNSGFNYVFSAGNAKVVLNALTSVTHVNVISSPQLLVLDHHVATLQVGDQVPVPVQQSESTITAGAPVINTIAYIDTGVILRVSPRVNTNGLITLDITQQVSQPGATTTSSLNAPTISQRRVDSTITVQDGQTIALGGLITDNKNQGKNGIPVLADIPVVGNLFGTTTNTAVRTELLIMLSPRIVHNAYEARSVTEELRSRLHALAPLGPQLR